MKHKLFSLSAALLFLNFAQAQSVNTIPFSEINVEYVQIIGSAEDFKTGFTSIEIDFGNEDERLTGKHKLYGDENEKRVVFNSMMDALNFMGKNGYELVNTYAESIRKDRFIYRFHQYTLMKTN